MRCGRGERAWGKMDLSRFELPRLQQGSANQRAAWRVLTELAILDILAPFHARLTGTIPIDVDIPGSDLDIICQADDLDALAQLLETHYGHHPSFQIAHKTRYGHPVLVCEFERGGFLIQVYGSSTPVQRQRAWVHMVAEAYLLDLGGEGAREAVRALKRAGEKTEPAFAQVFELAGDPYDVLYALGMHVLGELTRWVFSPSIPPPHAARRRSP